MIKPSDERVLNNKNNDLMMAPSKLRGVSLLTRFKQSTRATEKRTETFSKKEKSWVKTSETCQTPKTPGWLNCFLRRHWQPCVLMANYGRVARRQAGEAFDVANTAWESSGNAGAKLAETVASKGVPATPTVWKSNGEDDANVTNTIAPHVWLLLGRAAAMIARRSQLLGVQLRR